MLLSSSLIWVYTGNLLRHVWWSKCIGNMIPKHSMLPFTTHWANSADDKPMIFFLIFPRKQTLIFYANSKFAWNIKSIFWGNKKSTSKCHLLKFLPSIKYMQSINNNFTIFFVFLRKPSIFYFIFKGHDWLFWGLMKSQLLWVILCRFPEIERREIEGIVEEVKDRDRGERGKWMC